MGLLSWIFGKRTPSQSDYNKLPPLHGGDGLTQYTAVVVNCASMSTANMLMDRFISERHGPSGTAWTRGVEMTVNGAGLPLDSIRAIIANLKDGSSVTYYFNTARPFAATLKLMRAQGLIPPE